MLWFYETGDETVHIGNMPENELFEDHNIVLGSVNTALSKETLSRFGVTEIPCFIFLHKGQFYRYPIFITEYNWEAIISFVLEGYRNVPAEDVPPPRTEFDRMIEFFLSKHGLPLWIGLGFFLVLFMLYDTLIPPAVKSKKTEKES